MVGAFPWALKLAIGPHLATQTLGPAAQNPVLQAQLPVVQAPVQAPNL